MADTPLNWQEPKQQPAAPLVKTLCAAALGFLATLAHAAGPSCEAEPGLNVDRITERIVLVGETPGTEQAPAFVARLVCGLLAQGRPVILALGRDEAEQAVVNRFLASDGTTADVQALLRRPQWQSANQDGQSSQAMLKLLDDVRKWRHEGHAVDVLMTLKSKRFGTAHDFMTAQQADPKAFQAKLELIRADSVGDALERHPNHVAVVVTHGFQAAVGSGIHRSFAGAPSLGDLLAAREPVHVIGLGSDGGEAWICSRNDTCGPRPQHAGNLHLPDSRVDSRVGLGRLTASPPAMLVSAETPR